MLDSQLTIINHDVRGVLAARSGFLLPIRVLSSRAGYYIGTFSDNYGVISRESQYFDKRIDAEKALRNQNWIQRKHP